VGHYISEEPEAAAAADSSLVDFLFPHFLWFLRSEIVTFSFFSLLFVFVWEFFLILALR